MPVLALGGLAHLSAPLFLFCGLGFAFAAPIGSGLHHPMPSSGAGGGTEKRFYKLDQNIHQIIFLTCSATFSRGRDARVLKISSAGYLNCDLSEIRQILIFGHGIGSSH
jgi:hypothetical protein